jgi:hypothetical protein
MTGTLYLLEAHSGPIALPVSIHSSLEAARLAATKFTLRDAQGLAVAIEENDPIRGPIQFNILKLEAGHVVGLVE